MWRLRELGGLNALDRPSKLWGDPRGGQGRDFCIYTGMAGSRMCLCSPWLCLGALDSYALLTFFCVIFVVSGRVLKFAVFF